MPIIYMHGVNTRDSAHFEPVHEYLQSIVAPAISPRPQNVSIRAADWFQLCPPPKWGGISRPRTALFGMGGGSAPSEMLDAMLAAAPRTQAPASSFTSGSATSASSGIRLDQMSEGDLAD
jgi:hypothetical protein